MESEKNILINGGYPLHKFEDVEELYFSYIKEISDRENIRKAYEFILNKHQNQLRKSGEPYYHHLIEVCYILATLHCGPNTLCAGLLHDVVEDTDTTIEDIKKGWGDEVALLVDSLTKIQRLKLSKITSEEFEAEDHRKIFIGMAKDIRVIIIKLADRLHNLRTLSSLSKERQIAISKETMDVFVPIAHRLGLDTIKSEMENLTLKYLEPDKFYEIEKLLSKKAKTMSKSLEVLKKKIADLLFDNKIPFEISSRVKSIYSIYTKMYLKDHSFNEIYDILALRIITDTEIRCYEILGLIHKSYKPVPGRFKDYIAMPKPNLYQSLHTTVVGGEGNFYEIQIRTKEMDEVAESGIAAHWAYKEGSGYNSKKEQLEIENKLHWFRDFVSFSEETEAGSATEYVDSLTHDIFDSNVYVFTPKGKVVELPNGSTPIDFAYRIHSKVGDSTIGALVNGIMVPLNTVLKTGDMVEIKTSKIAQPSERWLAFVKTNQAKTRIRRFIIAKENELLKEERIEKGKQSILDAFKDRNINEEEAIKLLDTEKVLEHYQCATLDDLFIKITQRKPIPSNIIEFLNIKKPVEISSSIKFKNNQDANSCPVYAKGAGKIAINLANCCTPIPGDDIVGYITKGKGIAVHRKNCPNVALENERLVEVFWRDDIESAVYPVDIIIEASDRPHLLMDIMSCFTANKVNVDDLHAKSNKTNLTALVSATIYVSDSKRLRDIFNILQSIVGIYSIKRIIH